MAISVPVNTRETTLIKTWLDRLRGHARNSEHDSFRDAWAFAPQSWRDTFARTLNAWSDNNFGVPYEVDAGRDNYPAAYAAVAWFESRPRAAFA